MTPARLKTVYDRGSGHLPLLSDPNRRQAAQDQCSRRVSLVLPAGGATAFGRGCVKTGVDRLEFDNAFAGDRHEAIHRWRGPKPSRLVA